MKILQEAKGEGEDYNKTFSFFPKSTIYYENRGKELTPFKGGGGMTEGKLR